MTETLKNAVVSALSKAFGENVAIYTEAVRQGLLRPCLFVEGDTFSERHLVGNRFIRVFPIKITYFPKAEDIPTKRNFELDSALEKLFYSMGTVKSDTDVFRGSVMEARNMGDSLSFSVQYKTIINKVPEEDAVLMESISHIISKGSE